MKEVLKREREREKKKVKNYYFVFGSSCQKIFVPLGCKNQRTQRRNKKKQKKKQNFVSLHTAVIVIYVMYLYNYNYNYINTPLVDGISLVPLDEIASLIATANALNADSDL